MPPESTDATSGSALTDFALVWPRKAEPRPDPFESVWRTPSAPPLVAAPPVPCPIEEMRRQVEEAFERGYRSGQEDARRDSERRFDQLRLESERALVEVRAADLLEFVRDIGDRLEQGLGSIESQHSASVATMLVPFLKRALEGELLREALESVQHATALRPALVVKLCGPERLVAELSQELERRQIRHEAERSDGGDLTLMLDGAEIDLRLGVWLGQLEKAWL